MRKKQPKDKSRRQSQGWGDEAACANQQTEKENNFREHLQKSRLRHRGRAARPIPRLLMRRVQGVGDLRRFAERLDRFGFRATHIEHGQQFGHLQQIADALRQVRQLDGRSGV